ncbi:MAG: TetR-like C-terminal domain-containing protein, partial [Ruthenibacterium sp.]
EEKAVGMRVRDEDKTFIADFYKYAFVGLMLDWIKNGMKDEPKMLTARLAHLVQGNITSALQHISSKDTN